MIKSVYVSFQFLKLIFTLDFKFTIHSVFRFKFQDGTSRCYEKPNNKTSTK